MYGRDRQIWSPIGTEAQNQAKCFQVKKSTAVYWKDVRNLTPQTKSHAKCFQVKWKRSPELDTIGKDLSQMFTGKRKSTAVYWKDVLKWTP